MSDVQTPVGLPQLLVFLILGFLVIRWIFFSSTPSSQSTRDGHTAGRSRINPAQVEQVAQMFPQLDRRNIMWDLQRNGGNVQATTERILNGQPLEVPPPSFQPVLPQTSMPASGAARTNASTQTKVPTHQDLITRYKLHHKISGTSSSDVQAGANESQKRPTWSQSKAERQQLLQKRREEMILAARRKMEDKDQAAKTR